MSLNDRVITVTGGGSGIGRALVQVLAKEGAIVYAADVNQEGLDETVKLCAGSQVIGTVVDVSKRDQVDAWISSIGKEHGKIHGGANVAGIGGGWRATTIGDIVQEDWDTMIAVNLTGVMNCMRAQLQHLVRPGGSIVNVSSYAGIRGMVKVGAYAASKAGVVGLTKVAAHEYGAEGIRVNAVCPGPIDTPIFRNAEKVGVTSRDTFASDTLLARIGEAEEVADCIAFLLSSKSGYVTGVELPIDGGMAA